VAAVHLALKAALVGLLIFAVARPDLPQFAGKVMTGRAIAYPLAALVVPAVWWALSRRRRVAYPWAIDILLVLPFLIDTAGNMHPGAPRDGLLAEAVPPSHCLPD
jgi:hypothetical protein